MTKEDAVIIEAYKTAFSRYAKDGIIDMDARLKHKLNFGINRLEELFRELEDGIPLNRQSLFFVTLVKNGTGEKTIGRHTFPIKKNMLFFVPGRTVHATKNLSADFSGYNLRFNIDFFLQNIFPRHHIIKKKIFKPSVEPFIVLSGSQEKKLEIIFESILDEHTNELKDKNEMIAIKTLELLLECERFFSAKLTPEDRSINNDIVESFDKLIKANFLKERSVQFYASALHIHPNRLNYLIKKHTGLTAKETIIENILSEAKILLRSTSLPVKDISYKLGFTDPNHFSAFFRKTLNLSPAQYRSKLV